VSSYAVTDVHCLRTEIISLQMETGTPDRLVVIFRPTYAISELAVSILGPRSVYLWTLGLSSLV
jgi:hypothetical protein